MTSKWIGSRLVLAIAVMTILCATAFAHVTVSPRESTTGVSEKYTMRVPNERAASTIRLELEIPANVNVSYFEAKPGWKLEHKRDAKGKIITAIWSGGRIGPNEYMEFSFLGRNPADETTITWKIIQAYDDGTQSDWTAAVNVKKPTGSQQ